MNKKNLVCIHGNSLSPEIFDKIDGQHFNKISVTLPGHQSTEFKDIHSFLDIVKHVQKQIAKLDNIVLFGYSLGGHICHHLLDKIACESIITVAAPPISLETAAKAFLPNANVALLFKPDLNDNELNALATDMTENPLLVPYVKSMIKLTNPQVRTTLGISLGQGKFENEIEKLKSFRGKKIFIHPENDKFINGKYVKELNLGEFLTCPNGHLAILENPDFFNSVLQKI